EVAGGVGAGDGVECYQLGTAGPRTVGLVKAYVTVTADTQQHEVDAAGAFDQVFVVPAVGFHLIERHGAVGNVDVARRNVYVVEQGPAHRVVVALHLVGVQAVVLVDVERDHAGKIEPFF